MLDLLAPNLHLYLLPALSRSPLASYRISTNPHPSHRNPPLRSAGDVQNLQLRFPYRKQVLEERRTYLLVDLLTDLGGTMGLLLGYSLSSLVDVGDWLVMRLAARRKI